MMTGKDCVRPSVKVPLPRLAQIALTLRWRVVASLLSKLKTLTPWTTEPMWPAQDEDGLKTFGVVDAGLYVYHDAIIAH
jgi:hypothetical protein